MARTRLKIHLTQIVILIVLVTGTAVFLKPARAVIDERFALLKTQLIEQLETALGLKVRYDSIVPSIFSFIEIRGLRLYDGNRELAAVKNLKVYYRFTRLFSRDRALSVREIGLENAVISTDLEQDKKYLDLAKGMFAGGSGKGSIRVNGKNIRLAFAEKRMQADLSRFFFTLRLNNNVIDIDMKGRGAVEFSDPASVLAFVNTDITVNGSLALDLAWSQFKVRLDRFSSGLFSMPRLMFQVNYSPGRWDVVKIQDKSRIDISGSLYTDKKLFSVSFICDAFRAGSFINPGRGLKNLGKDVLGQGGLDDLFSLKLTGTGSFGYNWGSGRYTYGGNIGTTIVHSALPFPVPVEVSFSGNEVSATISALDADTPYGGIGFSGILPLGTLRPEGTLRIRNFPYLNDEKIQGDFLLGYNSEGILLHSENASVGSLAFNELACTLKYVSLQSAELSLSGSLGSAGNPAPGRSFLIDGTIQFSPFFLQAEASLVNLPVKDVLFLSGTGGRIPEQVKNIAGDFNVTSSLYATSDGSKFSFVCQQLLLAQNDAGEEGRFINASLSGNNESIIIPRYDVRWDKVTAGGSLNVAFEDRHNIRFDTDSIINDYAFKLSGSFVPNESFIARGSYGLNVLVLFTGGSYSFQASARELPLPFFEEKPVITADVSGYFQDTETWEAVVKRCFVTNLPLLPDLAPELQFAAKVNRDRVVLYNVDYQDLVSRLHGAGDLKVESFAPLKAAGWVSLKDLQEREQYETSLSVGEAGISARISMENAPLERIKGLPVEGRVSGLALISGPLREPDISGSLVMKNGRLFGEDANADIGFELNSSSLVLTKLALSYRTSNLQNTSGKLDFSTGELYLSSSYKVQSGTRPVSANVEISGKSGMPLARKDLRSALDKDWKGHITVSGIRAGARSFKDWSFDLEAVNRKTIINGGPDTSVSISINEKGDFRFILTDPLPVRLTAYGTLGKSNFEAVADIAEVDIEALKTYLKIPFFQMETGTGKGWLALSGTLRDPDFSGSLRVENTTAVNRIFPNTMGPFAATVNFDGKSMIIPEVTVPIAQGKARVTCNFIIDHWIPRSYEIIVAVPGGSRVPIADSFAGVEVKGYVDGSVVIQGDFDGLALTGKLNANTCSITLGERNREKPDNSKRPFMYTIGLDINIGRQMEFLWPTRDVPIFRAFAEANSKVGIQYDSDSGRYSIIGNVPIKGGQISYFSRNFYVREGQISFNENQESFDPHISVRAEIREVSVSGEDTRIYLVVQDNPFSKFTPRFESEPNLPEAEIFAMLGQDIVTGLGGNDINLSSALAATTNLLFAQFGLLRPIEDKIKEWFKLDLFSLRTQMMETLLKDVVFGQALPSYDSSPFGTLGKYLDNTTLFLGKYFGNDIFIEAMFSLRSKTTPYTEQLYTEELALESEISFEWKTPLALLQFTLMPDLQDLFSKPPEASLSLSWRFTF